MILEKSQDLKPTNIATLRGTLPTVFILMGGLISLTVPVFLTEYRRRICPLVLNVCGVLVFRHYHKSKRIAAKNIIGIAVAVCDTGSK